ncbi:hypothetical protein SOVF_125860 isoform B [Spinacia oleracea]|nr:hypothetical protein SOVF_125860 isoform B [Spinacia oleracea]
MFNPLTTTRIPLPHQSTMPGHDFYDDFFDKDDMDFYELRGLFLEKVLVIQVDDGGGGRGDYIIITIPGQPNGIVTYAKPGDLVWTSIITKEINIEACVKDVVRWGSQIIFLYADGVTGYCDINALNHSNLEPAMLMKYLPPPERFIPPYKVYLLVSFGDLLMVSRHKRCINDEIEDDPDDFSYQTIDFEVRPHSCVYSADLLSSFAPSHSLEPNPTPEMKIIAACLLVALGGKACTTAGDVKKFFGSD